jgi:quinol monooxygenase YgiN
MQGDEKMIVLNVTYKCRPGQRREFLERIAAEGIDTASRAEAGNIRYDYYLPVNGEDELFLLEKWRDAEALAAHGTQPHFEKLKALKSEYVADTTIDRFESRE